MLQDCFGFNWNLPRFIKEAEPEYSERENSFGIDCENSFGMAHWEGPDGSQIPILHLYFGYLLPINYGKDYPLLYLS